MDVFVPWFLLFFPFLWSVVTVCFLVGNSSGTLFVVANGDPGQMCFLVLGADTLEWGWVVSWGCRDTQEGRW